MEINQTFKGKDELRAIGLVGKKFGRLEIIGYSIKSTDKWTNSTHLMASCLCGKTVEISPMSKVTGKKSARSCGCLKSEKTSQRFKKHGMSNSRLYYVWHGMKRRCLDESDIYYGSIGIKFCDEWNEFAPFFEWAMSNGYREGLQLDRFPDCNGDYHPGNCRWATPEQNNNNQRRTIFLCHDGMTMTISDWSKKTGLSKELIRSRLNNGWSHSDSVTVPKISGRVPLRLSRKNNASK